MPEVLSLAEAVRLRLVVYQLLELSVPLGSRVTLGAIVSSQNDFEDETARPDIVYGLYVYVVFAVWQAKHTGGGES